MIKAAIFDMDGVIIDNQPYQKMAWHQLFNEYGIQLNDKDLTEKVRGRPTTVGLKNLLNNRFTEKEIEKMANKKEEIYTSIFKKNFKPVSGFVDFLKDLKKTEILVALATSSTKELVDFTINHLGIKKDLFDFIISSDKVVLNKPHPEIYLETAKNLKVRPEECVVFEDSFSGVRSANNANMKVVLVMTTHDKEEFRNEKIDLAINDFTEIAISDILGMQ